MKRRWPRAFAWRLVLPLMAATTSLLSLTVIGARSLTALGAERRGSHRARAEDVQNACALLTMRVCDQLGESSDACALAKPRLSAAAGSRCRDALAHTEQTAREFREHAAGLHALVAREQRTLHGMAPQRGPDEAELTWVEFADFQSEDCGRAAPMAQVLARRYPERARVVFRQFPSSRHPDARLAAEASLAAHAQGKFWPYHDMLFANPHDLGRVALERYAREVGLDLSAFREALDTHRFEADVDADILLARSVHASERPSLFVNGKHVSVPYGVAELEELVRSLDAR